MSMCVYMGHHRTCPRADIGTHTHRHTCTSCSALEMRIRVSVKLIKKHTRRRSLDGMDRLLDSKSYLCALLFSDGRACVVSQLCPLPACNSQLPLPSLMFWCCHSFYYYFERCCFYCFGSRFFFLSLSFFSLSCGHTHNDSLTDTCELNLDTNAYPLFLFFPPYAPPPPPILVFWRFSFVYCMYAGVSLCVCVCAPLHVSVCSTCSSRVRLRWFLSPSVFSSFPFRMLVVVLSPSLLPSLCRRVRSFLSLSGAFLTML